MHICCTNDLLVRSFEFQTKISSFVPLSIKLYTVKITLTLLKGLTSQAVHKLMFIKTPKSGMNFGIQHLATITRSTTCFLTCANNIHLLNYKFVQIGTFMLPALPSTPSVNYGVALLGNLLHQYTHHKLTSR